MDLQKEDPNLSFIGRKVNMSSTNTHKSIFLLNSDGRGEEFGGGVNEIRTVYHANPIKTAISPDSGEIPVTERVYIPEGQYLVFGRVDTGGNRCNLVLIEEHEYDVSNTGLVVSYEGHYYSFLHTPTGINVALYVTWTAATFTTSDDAAFFGLWLVKIA